MTTSTLARHHRHLDRYKINLNGLSGVSIRKNLSEEGIYFEIVGTYVVYDYFEFVVLFTSVREENARALADGLTTIIDTLVRSDPEFAETLIDPNER